MAKWVYIRGFPMVPHDTLFYTACANNYLNNVQTLCGLSATEVDLTFFPTLALISITYESGTPIDLTTRFPY